MKPKPTFREQVAEFWQWFPTIAQSLAETIKGDDQEKALAYIGEQFANEVQEKIGGLSWVFGSGESAGRLSFTVTGEGQAARQMLSHFWLSQAIEVPGWDFYAARQPSSEEHLENCSIEVGETIVDVDSMMIATDVDDENSMVNIRAWHESFENLEDIDRFQILYLLLDEALGEFGTQTKLGNIEFKLDVDARPLRELPGYLDTLWSEKGWEEHSPLETYSGYGAEPSEGFERSDTITGYTCVPNVVLEFLNNEGSLDEDPIEGTGAEYVFVQIERGPESLADPLEFREAIENEISKRLNGGGGYVVGGATGIQFSYVDIVIFDGNRSLTAIREAMEEMEVDDDYEIKSFVS